MHEKFYFNFCLLFFLALNVFANPNLHNKFLNHKDLLFNNSNEEVLITPTFATIPPICLDSVLSPLPTTSINGIAGTWSPSLNNTQTTIYTFTPDAGQDATTVSMVITVSQKTTPTFVPIVPICSGASLSPLPTTSTNGITGTWSPSVISNTNTTIYTFTPNPGQCATVASITITVNPKIIPIFSSIAICSGSTPPILSSTSPNGIVGTWSPSVISNTTSGTYVYTPNAGQCATSTTMIITVNRIPVIATNSTSSSICSGNSTNTKRKYNIDQF